MVMKYWNKDKKIREKYWHRIKVNRSNMTNYCWDDIKRILQLYPSNGKFFMIFAYSEIEFELEKDALWWALRWS